MRDMRRTAGAIGLATGLLVTQAPLTTAGAGEVWPVEGRLIGEGDKKAKDVSGIACAENVGFPRTCLVIDDELQDAQFVKLENGKVVAGDAVHLIDDQHDGKALSLDGEGVAYDDGFFYVTGSHGHPRDRDHKLKPDRDADKISATIAASSKIIRVRDGDAEATDQTIELKGLFAVETALQPFVDKRLDENGATIEGIAVLHGRLFVGFRGPSVNDTLAAVVSVAVAALFGDGTTDTRLDLLPLGSGRGVRDFAPFRDGLLVLAGPTADDDSSSAYSIFWWAGNGGPVKLLGDLPASATENANQLKPEAILPLDESADRLRVLVFFDGEKEGGPRDFEVALP